MARQDESTYEAHGRRPASLLARAGQMLAEVRDAVIRSSQASKIRIDATMVRRERDARLRDLGRRVYELAEQGELQVPPGLETVLEDLRAFDRTLEEHERELAEVETGEAHGGHRNPAADEGEAKKST